VLLYILGLLFKLPDNDTQRISRNMAGPAGGLDGHPLGAIPPLTLQPGIDARTVNAENLVCAWLASFGKRSDNGLSTHLADLFIEDSWWRDFLGLSWDIVTKNGIDVIKGYVDSSTTDFGNLEVINVGGLKPMMFNMQGAVWVQGGFTFKTAHGTGRGLVRLINVEKDQWKAWNVFTQLERLNSQDKIDAQRLEKEYTQTRSRVPNGVHDNNYGDLQVLIIGAGKLWSSSR
jgi:hypothetical protein